jgi:hypothetical protein
VPSGGDVLSARALNRALMARQGLVERSAMPVAEMIERLVGMQAQVPSNPYVALWSRLRDFDPAELSDLIATRDAVRAGAMRATIHLLTARDCLAIQPITGDVLERAFRSGFGKATEGVDIEAVAAAGRELLEEEPRTRAELARLLAPRWPGVEPETLGLTVTFKTPLVQVPPRGLWGQTSQARWALTERWLGAPLDGGAAVDALVVRYLAAFGPATVADIRTWSRLTGLRAVVERLRPRLRTFRDERGRELFDVPDAPLPHPDTPVPVRFLPEYDNVLLAHDDRSRVISGLAPSLPVPTGRWIGTLLVDGFFRAYWRLAEEEGIATLTIDRFTPDSADPPATAQDVAAEGERLLAFLAPAAGRRKVSWGNAPPRATRRPRAPRAP